MKYFTINELCKSDIASSRQIDNQPSPEVVDNLEALINNCLDPIREAWGGPIRVNSGYRSPALNKAVKGSKTSQHLTGCAADITVGSRNKELFNLIKDNFQFDQLIDEYNYNWIHISYKENPRNQVLHLK